MREASVIIVGAGIGGLVAAIELAREGVAVTVLERAEGPGGKMRAAEIHGRQIESGPTVFTMRWVLDAICERAGTSLESLVTLDRAETLARHWWPDGSELDLFADADRSTAAVAAFAGADEASRFREFTAASARIYRTLEKIYIEASRPSLPALVARAGIGGLPGLAGIKPFATMWGELGRYFRDPRLRQLFARYSTYCGSSPFAAPATLMLIAHAESQGVWLLREGMHGLADALAGLARSKGAKLRYGAHVDAIETDNSRASAVRLATGERIAADAVLWNGDVAALASGLAGATAERSVRSQRPRHRSLSALTWSMLVPRSEFPLDRHNVFFATDYAAEFRDLVADRRLPETPTIYICAQDRPSFAGTEARATDRLLCLVNAPATGDLGRPPSSEIDACETRTFARLASFGLALTPAADCTVRRTPADYERMFPATGGALYGMASHGWTASFRRSGATTSIPNLYLAGGSVHPGAGVPMAATSGRLAAQAVLAGLSSRAPYGRAAMPGGTSTEPATTGSTR